MDARTRREALRAAAKVALSVAAFGSITCGGKTSEPEGAAVLPSRSGSAVSTIDLGECDRTLDAVRAEASADSAAGEPVAPASGSGGVRDCCAAIIGRWWDASRANIGTEVPEHRSTCCWAPGVEGFDHVGCMPWGPPMPPTFG
jgi:hypothetical protein